MELVVYYPMPESEVKFFRSSLEVESGGVRHPLPLSEPFRHQRNWQFENVAAVPCVWKGVCALRVRFSSERLLPGMVPELPAKAGGDIAPYSVDVQLELYDAPVWDHQLEMAQAMLYIEDLQESIPYAHTVPPPEPVVPKSLGAETSECPAAVKVRAVRSRGLLLASEEGTGKTRAAILAALNAGEPAPALPTVLVICSKRAVDHWVEEIAQFNLECRVEAVKSIRGYEKVAKDLVSGAIDFLVVPYGLFKSNAYEELEEQGGIPLHEQHYSYVMYDDLHLMYGDMAEDPAFFKEGKQPRYLNIRSKWTLVLSSSPYEELWQMALICYLLRVELEGEALEARPEYFETFAEYTERLAAVPRRFLERVLLDNFTARQTRESVGLGASVTKVLEGELSFDMTDAERAHLQKLRALGADAVLLQDACDNPDLVEDAGARVPLLENLAKRRLSQLLKRHTQLLVDPKAPAGLLQHVEFCMERLHGLEESKEEDCPICYKEMKGSASLNCGHRCCTECFESLLRAKQERKKNIRCPECREAVDFDRCTERPADAEPIDQLTAKFGSKIGQLLDHLSGLLREDDSAKVLLHCGRPSTAAALEQALAASRVPHMRLRGSGQAMQNKVAKFRTKDISARVLVVLAEHPLGSFHAPEVSHLLLFEATTQEQVDAAKAMCVRPGRTRPLVLLRVQIA